MSASIKIEKRTLKSIIKRINTLFTLSPHRPTMIHHTATNGVPYLHFETLPTGPLCYGIFTRHGGVSSAPWHSLNFSVMVGDERGNVQQNNTIAYAALGLSEARQIERHIAHTTAVWHVTERELGVKAPFADAIVTRTRHLSIVMTSADCQLLLAYDPVEHVLGVAHAGWRSTLGGITLSLVQAMCMEGSRASDLWVGIGPAIGSCCYEVGEDVVEHARRWPRGEKWIKASSNGRLYLDMSLANESLLRDAGVRHIEQSYLCTACRTDLFFSHRAERPVTGRFAIIASLS